MKTAEPRDPGIGQLAIRGRHDGAGVVGFPQLGGRSRGVQGGDAAVSRGLD